MRAFKSGNPTEPPKLVVFIPRKFMVWEFPNWRNTFRRGADPMRQEFCWPCGDVETETRRSGVRCLRS